MYMINRCSLLMIIAKIRPLPFEHFDCYNNTDERKAIRKHSLLGRTAASVLSKLFISGNEICHTDAP